MLTAIDTNIISALWSKEPASEGVAASLFAARQQGALVLCAVVQCGLLAYPGASPRFVQKFLEVTDIQVHYALSEMVWQTAGEAFAAYARRRREDKAGQPKRLLADFIVGAHALHAADRLLTLDAKRYLTSFPTLEVIGREG